MANQDDMMQKRKIAVLTGTRAEYGLLLRLMLAIRHDPDLTLQLIVTGTHLSPEFGYSYREIEADGFTIDANIEMLLSSDTGIGVAKSMGLAVIGLADALARLKPDLLVLLGDRYETLSAAQVALVLQIPIAHIHGGELSLGAMDDAMRHAITKMSHLHFVAANAYRQRVIQMGEHPSRVFNVGSPGLERIKKTVLLDKSALIQRLGCSFKNPLFLVTYHPETHDLTHVHHHINALLTALEKFPEATLIITKANADESGRYINERMTQFAAQQPCHRYIYDTLGDLNYLSLLPYVDVVIGNSSSGIIEVPYFKKPTVNIGNRQACRLRSASIIDVVAEASAIESAIHKALSTTFLAHVAITEPAYTQADTATNILHIIKDVDLTQLITKHFYDLDVTYA